MTQEEMKLLKQMGMKDEVIVDQQQKIEAFENDIKKQLEAVRGLIDVYNKFKTTGEHLSLGLEDAIDDFRVKLTKLTETLRPYLNGEKLEV